MSRTSQAKANSDGHFFVAQGVRYGVTLQSLTGAFGAKAGMLAGSYKAARRTKRPSEVDLNSLLAVLGQGADRLKSSTSERRRLAFATMKAASTNQPATMIGTDTVIVEGARRADIAFAKSQGAEVVMEGYEGKALLRAQDANQAFALIAKLSSRNLDAVAPNFLRLIPRLRKTPVQSAWAHAKIGVEGAWRITQGSADVRVAVLDEGVDTAHPALKPSVWKERDFIGSKGDSAMPDGDDAHGTACAGIIASRDSQYPGIAPRCSLIAARIAMGDGRDGWVFEDWATADAIDWAWKEGADILSNSWGGGWPSDAISRAFARALSKGRQGKGSVVVIAAGNGECPIGFPGTLPGCITVGASTPADERKTHKSSDAEAWWGSNYGPSLSLLAPGVFIHTSDITGPRGYGADNFIDTFNGTSAAAPHVAAAAALLLSVKPGLGPAEIQQVLETTATRLDGQVGRVDELGWGRLNVAAALRSLVSANPPKPAQPKRPPRQPTPPRRRRR